MTGNFFAFYWHAYPHVCRGRSSVDCGWLQKQAGSTVVAMRRQPAALGWVAFGALFGPVLGVSASLLAVQHADIGVASTLMALPPVFMLPISYFFMKGASAGRLSPAPCLPSPG